jgi:hypothetical protein
VVGEGIVRNRFVPGILALALVAAGSAVAAAPAGAARVHLSAIAPGGLQSSARSDYLAGYQITEPGISRASERFKVPTMVCGSGDDVTGTAIGIGNEQVVGSPTLLGVVFLACVSGVAQYSVQVLAGGSNQTSAVTAGDIVVVSVVQTARTVTVVVNDVTQNLVTKASGPTVPDTTLTFGLLPLFYGSTTPLPVADFGRARISQPTLESASLQLWSPLKLNRASAGVPEVTTGNFSPTGAFKLSFNNP